MNSENRPHLQAMKALSIVGSASAINIVLNLARNKAAAILLGAEGVGLIGLLGNLLSLASAFGSLGLSNAGTRSIAAAHGQFNVGKLGRALSTLRASSVVFALLAALLFWLLRAPMARYFLQDSAYADTVGWLCIGVFLSIISGAQIAALTGVRHLAEVARITIGAALASATFGILSLWLYGASAILVFILVSPFASMAFGWCYANRLTKSIQVTRVGEGLWSGGGALVKQGVVFMCGAVAGPAANLMVRAEMHRELGLEAAGHLQAAWTLSITCVGFILGAIASDYFPRLASIVEDSESSRKLIEHQVEFSLLISTPLLLLLAGWAPWMLEFLFSSDFLGASEIFQAQILGDFFKIAGWPLAFYILAANALRTFIMLEWVCAACFFGLAELLLPLIGAAGAGWAYTGMYATYLLFFSIAARRLCPLLNLRPACLLLIQGCGGLVLVIAAQLLFDHGAAVATGFSFFFCVRAWRRIRAELRV